MYSVRMRAARDNIHISGAEQIVDEKDIRITMQSLIERALSHERGKPDFLSILLEEIKTPIKYLISLPITLLNTENVDDGKKVAKRVLAYHGIPDFCIQKAFTLLEKGPSNGESMRGAILMDMGGKRLEPDKHRGIRASRMDITKEAFEELERLLAAKGLSKYYTHIKEALVIATKVASVKGSIAELCWSDDPFYTTGYVASKKLGYVRIQHLKYEGDSRGGRVFFVENMGIDNTEDYIDEIEKTPVLINKFAGIRETFNFAMGE